MPSEGPVIQRTDLPGVVLPPALRAVGVMAGGVHLVPARPGEAVPGAARCGVPGASGSVHRTKVLKEDRNDRVLEGMRSKTRDEPVFRGPSGLSSGILSFPKRLWARSRLLDCEPTLGNRASDQLMTIVVVDHETGERQRGSKKRFPR